MTEVRLADGGHLSVAVQGEGPPLLLVRPLGGSLVSWGSFADTLASGARVVAFDARGSGCSSAAPLATTTRSMAADAVALLDALAMARADVFGSSLGGMVASWLAIDASERVGRLILASTPVRGLAVHPGGWRRVFALARCLALPARATEACLATQVLSREFRARHSKEVARIRARAAARPASHRGLLAHLAAAALHDIRPRLRNLGAATLVVAGERDALLPACEQQRLAASLPRGRFAVIPDAGHDVTAEAPETVANLVLAHLARGT